MASVKQAEKLPTTLPSPPAEFQCGGLSYSASAQVWPDWLQSLRNDPGSGPLYYRCTNNDFHDEGSSHDAADGKKRVGVPGGERMTYKGSCGFFEWQGSAFQAAAQSKVFYLYMTTLLCSCFAFTFFGWQKLPEAPQWVIVSLGSLCTFFATFYCIQVYVRYTQRFHDICRTNGGVTLISALSAAWLPRTQAETLVRYGLAMLNMYYMMIKGPITPNEWCYLTRRGMLTLTEVAVLHHRPKSATVRPAPCRADIARPHP